MIAAALVLAAGRSTRIANVAGGGPKPLLELGGRTLLEWNLAWLAASGVRLAWINLHHRPEAVRTAVGDGSRWGLSVRYSHEEELLGTAGAWRRLGDQWDATSLVVYGDNLMRFDLESFLSTHVRSGTAATAALFDPARHLNTGIAGSRVEIARDRVIGFTEGSSSGRGLVAAGAYLLEPGVATDVPDGFVDFGRDVCPALAERGELAAHVLEEGAFCLGVDTPAAYLRAKALLREGKVPLA